MVFFCERWASDRGSRCANVTIVVEWKGIVSWGYRGVKWLRKQCESNKRLSTALSHQWKHFPSYWPFVRGIHRSPVNFPHKGQWRGVLMFSLIYVWIIGWVNNREAGDLRWYRGHYDVIVMIFNARMTCVSWQYVLTDLSLTHKQLEMHGCGFTLLLLMPWC